MTWCDAQWEAHFGRCNGAYDEVMKPFVLLATRPEDDVALEEYDAVRRFGGLQESQLEHLRLEKSPVPQLELDRYSGIIVGGSPFNSSDPAEEKSASTLR